MSRLTTTDIWSLLAVGVLTAVAAFLAAAETGLTRMSRARAMHLREEQRRGSAQLLALVESPARFLNLVLLLVLVQVLVLGMRGLPMGLGGSRNHTSWVREELDFLRRS